MSAITCIDHSQNHTLQYPRITYRKFTLIILWTDAQYNKHIILRHYYCRISKILTVDIFLN